MLPDPMPILAAADAANGEGGNLVTQIFGPFGVQLNLLIAQIITFVIVAAILYYLAIKPVMATMDERNRKIADGLQYEEEMKSKLAETEREKKETIQQAQQEAQQIVQDSKRRAEDYYNKQTAETQRKVEDMLRRAEEAAEQERKQVLADARQEVSRLVVATAAKVLERELDAAEKQRFNDAAAKEVAS
jgi:F-type H+-transporting ATPase subunit b